MRHCGATQAEWDRAWPIISRHFHKEKQDSESLFNDQASVFRKNYFDYIAEQREKGKKGGRPKSNKNNDMKSSGLSPGLENEKPNESQTNQPKLTKLTNQPDAPAIPSAEFPETAKAIREHYPEVDGRFVMKLANAVGQMAAGQNGKLRGNPTDSLIAEAVRHCAKASPKQNSAGLYLQTVPQCVCTWLTQGKPTATADTPEYFSSAKHAKEVEEYRRKNGLI